MSDNTSIEKKNAELKAQALRESFAQKVVAYEDQIADMRVEFTNIVEQLQQRIAELEGQNEAQEATTTEPS